jgi:hypothetical protein
MYSFSLFYTNLSYFLYVRQALEAFQNPVLFQGRHPVIDRLMADRLHLRFALDQ